MLDPYWYDLPQVVHQVPMVYGQPASQFTDLTVKETGNAYFNNLKKVMNGVSTTANGASIMNGALGASTSNGASTMNGASSSSNNMRNNGADASVVNGGSVNNFDSELLLDEYINEYIDKIKHEDSLKSEIESLKKSHNKLKNDIKLYQKLLDELLSKENSTTLDVDLSEKDENEHITYEKDMMNKINKTNTIMNNIEKIMTHKLGELTKCCDDKKIKLHKIKQMTNNMSDKKKAETKKNKIIKLSPFNKCYPISHKNGSKPEALKKNNVKASMPEPVITNKSAPVIKASGVSQRMKLHFNKFQNHIGNLFNPKNPEKLKLLIAFLVIIFIIFLA